MTRTPFTFGVALTPRANALDWGRVQALLDLTLATVRAQTDPDWRLIVAGHERPRLPADRRITFAGVDWPVQPPGPHNDDSGRKKHLINDCVLEAGGGLLMLLDADDWADRRTVEASRTALTGEAVGGLIETGWAVDARTLRAAALPDARLFEGGYHRLCGSSTVAVLRPEADDPVRRDPFTHLRSHHQWTEAAGALGVELASLPVEGGYLVNTGENHSDLYGPHASWRRGFIAAVNRHGRPLDRALAARFGLTVEQAAAACAEPVAG